jgi:hypothetical protein
VLNNKVASTAPALTSSVELHATPNGTLASVIDAQEYIYPVEMVTTLAHPPPQ